MLAIPADSAAVESLLKNAIVAGDAEVVKDTEEAAVCAAASVTENVLGVVQEFVVVLYTPVAVIISSDAGSKVKKLDPCNFPPEYRSLTGSS